MQSSSEKKIVWIALIVVGIITVGYIYEDLSLVLHGLPKMVDFLVLWALIIGVTIFTVMLLYQFITKPRDKGI